MNEINELAVIEARIRKKLLLLESLVQDFREIEERELLPPNEYEQFVEGWGFSKTGIDFISDARSIHADVGDYSGQDFFADPLCAIHFVNLNSGERKKLAQAVIETGLPISAALVHDLKANLFPGKYLNL